MLPSWLNVAGTFSGLDFLLALSLNATLSLYALLAKSSHWANTELCHRVTESVGHPKTGKDVGCLPFDGGLAFPIETL